MASEHMTNLRNKAPLGGQKFGWIPGGFLTFVLFVLFRFEAAVDSCCFHCWILSSLGLCHILSYSASHQSSNSQGIFLDGILTHNSCFMRKLQETIPIFSSVKMGENRGMSFFEHLWMKK